MQRARATGYRVERDKAGATKRARRRGWKGREGKGRVSARAKASGSRSGNARAKGMAMAKTVNGVSSLTRDGVEQQQQQQQQQPKIANQMRSDRIRFRSASNTRYSGLVWAGKGKGNTFDCTVIVHYLVQRSAVQCSAVQ